MNIFFLDENPCLAAEYHCDKHVVKMVVEYSQILSSVCRLNGNENESLYRITHRHHPSVIWAGSSIRHFDWLKKLLQNLSEEYTLRYGKVHVSSRIFSLFEASIPDTGWSEPPETMPDIYKTGNPVLSYRRYYALDKVRFATWRKPRDIPFFMR